MSGPMRWISAHCFPSGLQKRYEAWKYDNPVWWAGFGGLSRMIGRLLPVSGPPIVVMSLPRSGSSWMGSTTALSPNALYLREPLTRTKDKPPSVLPLRGIPLPEEYDQAAKLAFAGLPMFPRNICVNPWEWKLRRRTRGRVLVKEVNPYALEWLCKEYRPFVVLLVRHPAGVALSYRKFGWWDSAEGDWEHPDRWRIIGDYQGECVRFALSFLEDYGDFHAVRYEDLCADPLRAYAKVIRRMGLEWTADMEQLLATRISERDPRAMIRSWDESMTQEELDELRSGYEPHGLPWYTDEADWRTTT